MSKLGCQQQEREHQEYSFHGFFLDVGLRGGEVRGRTGAWPSTRSVAGCVARVYRSPGTRCRRRQASVERAEHGGFSFYLVCPSARRRHSTRHLVEACRALQEVSRFTGAPRGARHRSGLTPGASFKPFPRPASLLTICPPHYNRRANAPGETFPAEISIKAPLSSSTSPRRASRPRRATVILPSHLPLPDAPHTRPLGQNYRFPQLFRGSSGIQRRCERSITVHTWFAPVSNPARIRPKTTILDEKLHPVRAPGRERCERSITFGVRGRAVRR